jgi:MinD superfamily P-loop ATPase
MMIHARLHPGQENSGKLVCRLRKEARALAERDSLDLVLCDGAPGIACPVIASLTGADLALIVVEPTVSGIHDMERVLDLGRHFQIPMLVCINRADLNETIAQRIERLAERRDAQMVGRVPFDRTVVDAQMCGRSVVEHGDSPAAAAIRETWHRTEARLNGDRPLHAEAPEVRHDPGRASQPCGQSQDLEEQGGAR